MTPIRICFLDTEHGAAVSAGLPAGRSATLSHVLLRIITQLWRALGGRPICQRPGAVAVRRRSSRANIGRPAGAGAAGGGRLSGRRRKSAAGGRRRLARHLPTAAPPRDPRIYRLQRRRTAEFDWASD